MEKNPYSMAKLGLENHGPQRDCGFYAKYVFLFLSLIQFLIIFGLVLFMVYGNNQASTEVVTAWLQECRASKELLSKEKANLTNLLNVSRAKSRQIQGQLNGFNATARNCSADKQKLQGQLRNTEAMLLGYRECYTMLSIFNATYPEQVKALQAQLQAQTLQRDLEKKNLAQENQGLQAKVKKTEQEVAACQREVLQVRTQVQKVGELEAKVMSEMQSARQSLKSAVETALPRQAIWCSSVEEVKNLRETCLNLSKQLDFYIDTLRRGLEDRIHTVATENAVLQKEKAACSQELLEWSDKVTTQEQRFVQEKQALQLAGNAETAKIYAEQQKLLSEKEALRQELERMRRVFPPSNPAARPPGVPGAAGGTNLFPGFAGFNPAVPVGAPNHLNAHWPRAGPLALPPSTFSHVGPEGNLAVQRNPAPLGHVGSHRPSSHSGYARLEEGKKAAGANATFHHQPVLKPAGHSRTAGEKCQVEMAVPPRQGTKPKAALPPHDYEGYVEKKAPRGEEYKKFWAGLRGLTIYFYSTKRDSQYVELLDLTDFVSLADDNPPRTVAAWSVEGAKLTLKMISQEVKLKMESVESREIWKGFILTMVEMKVPSGLSLLPGHIYMLSEALEKETERRAKMNLPDSQGGSPSPKITEGVFRAGGEAPEAKHPDCFFRVSRTEAVMLLEKNEGCGNMLLRPGRDGRSVSVTTRQVVDGNAIVKHYKVNQVGNQYIVDVEDPYCCSSLAGMVEFFVRSSKKSLIPLQLDDSYSEILGFMLTDKENGESTRVIPKPPRLPDIPPLTTRVVLEQSKPPLPPRGQAPKAPPTLPPGVSSAQTPQASVPENTYMVEDEPEPTYINPDDEAEIRQTKTPRDSGAVPSPSLPPGSSGAPKPPDSLSSRLARSLPRGCFVGMSEELAKKLQERRATIEGADASISS